MRTNENEISILDEFNWDLEKICVALQEARDQIYDLEQTMSKKETEYNDNLEELQSENATLKEEIERLQNLV